MDRTTQVAVAPGRVVIQTHGLRELSKLMTAVAIDDLPKVFAAEMREAGQPIADLARMYAPSTSGAFASSIRIAGGRGGISLQAKDEAAGVIEFARPGAIAHVPPHERQGHTVGAYTRPVNIAGAAPRALFPAIENSLPFVEMRVDAAVTKATQAYVDAAKETLD